MRQFFVLFAFVALVGCTSSTPSVQSQAKPIAPPGKPPPAASAPSLDFSDANNSEYISQFGIYSASLTAKRPVQKKKPVKRLKKQPPKGGENSDYLGTGIFQ